MKAGATFVKLVDIASAIKGVIMKDNKNENGLGIMGTVQLILIILKLFHLIDVSWYLIFLPTFIYLGIIITMFIALIVVTITDRKKETNEKE